MVSSSSPTVLTQYPRLQKCSPVTRLFAKICRWIRTAFLFLVNPIPNATLCFRGMLRHIWIWSGIRCPSNRSIPRCRHTSRSSSPTCFRSFPYRFLFRYFGIITTWYLRSHRTWDKLCHSWVGSFSLSFHGTFPGEKPILFLPGSVEPIRVLHQGWMV